MFSQNSLKAARVSHRFSLLPTNEKKCMEKWMENRLCGYSLVAAWGQPREEKLAKLCRRSAA
jgi:hypothetical protein